jgi:uncharacterized protein
MFFDNDNEFPWYAAGLHFECLACGNCCSGPEEGYIWLVDEESKIIADTLGISVQEFKSRYTKRIMGKNRSIVEDPATKDCIFLADIGKIRGCRIYDCRPNQCRTWPFWDINLISPDAWNIAAKRCPGINRGRLYTFEEIEKRRTRQKWW